MQGLETYTKLKFYIQLLHEKDKLGFSETQRKKSVDKTSLAGFLFPFGVSQWKRVMETEKESDFQKVFIVAEVFFLFFIFTYVKK